MRPTPRRLRPIAGALAVASVAIAGCGAGSTGAATGRSPAPTSTASASPDAAPNPGPGRSALPHVVVNDVGAGAKVDLATLSPGERPLLVWFWAPH